MIFAGRLSRKDDADLVRLISGGNEDAFREVLNRHQNAVYGFARRMLSDEQEAEDVAQETFLRFYKSSSRYRPDASLKTFLLKIAKNLCIDFYRKKKPELMDEIPDPVSDETPHELLENAVFADHIEKAVEKLPANQKAVVLLRHRENLSYARIAEVMDISVSAVDSLLVRARRTLRQSLTDI